MVGLGGDAGGLVSMGGDFVEVGEQLGLGGDGDLDGLGGGLIGFCGGRAFGGE